MGSNQVDVTLERLTILVNGLRETVDGLSNNDSVATELAK